MMNANRRPQRGAQRGIVLIISLIVLVAMTLAGLVMLRAVNANQGITGNLAFRQNATSAADRGTEAGWAWVMDGATDKTLDSPTNGYFATWNGGVVSGEFDPLRYDWGPLGDATNTKSRDITMGMTGGDDGTGNRIQVVVHRLCKIVGQATAAGQDCVTVPGSLQAGTGGGGAGNNIGSGLIKRPYYRLTAKVTGPRNTVSYVQVIMF